MTEHEMNIKAVHVFTGYIYPSDVRADGELSPIAEEVDFDHEKSRSYKCSCGRRFNKQETAIEHLRSVSSNASNGDGGFDAE